MAGPGRTQWSPSRDVELSATSGYNLYWLPTEAAVRRREMKMFCRIRGTFVALAAAALAFAAPASAASQSGAAGSFSTHVDQATMDFDYSLNGPQLEINAGNIYSTYVWTDPTTGLQWDCVEPGAHVEQ